MNKDNNSKNEKIVYNVSKLLEEATEISKKHGLCLNDDGDKKTISEEDFLQLIEELSEFLVKSKDLTQLYIASNAESPSYVKAGGFCSMGCYKLAYIYLTTELKSDPNAHVHMSLGDMYYYGLGVKKNLELAFKYYQEAIENHEIEESLAEALIGYYKTRAEDYKDGITGEKDINKAIEFYEKAFNCGSVLAAGLIGDIYNDGELVPKDKEKALYFYKKAALQGALDEEYKPYFDKINTGITFNNAGYLLVNTDDKDAKENEIALEYFKKAAALDIDAGYSQVGLMYERGLGVPDDTTEAIKWYRLAADLGNKDAEKVVERLENNKSKK